MYLGFVWWLTGDRIADLKGMDLNEVGDFLAGAFGPLAILWLVLGFFQQGIELRQGTAALNFQGEELRNSVEQQRKLASISLQALELEHKERQEQNVRYRQSLRPILHLTGINLEFLDSRWVATCRLFNDGAQIYSLNFALIKGGNQHYFHVVRTLDRGESVDAKCMWHIDSPGEDVAIVVFCTERDTVKGFCRFVMDCDPEPGSISFMRDDSVTT
ncbi:hypothetical protein D9M71_633330 [compost metagenome]